ncbi:MAG TPA: hypothetical protein VGM54_13885 [Chthoniobacter sp.]
MVSRYSPPDFTIIHMRLSFNRAIADSQLVEMSLRIDELTGWDASPEVVVLAASASWVLVRDLDNGLYPDGFTAISRRLVRSLHTTQHRIFRKRSLQDDGVWPRLVRVPSIELTSATTILKFLRKRNKLAIVLTETFTEWHSLHCRVEDVTDREAVLLGFDGAGKWEPRQKRLAISDITRIRFGSRYLDFYRKHMA